MKRFVSSLVFVCWSTAASASTPAVDAAASQVFHETMSPYCPGLLLADCRSDAASRLRGDIRHALEGGASVAEVRAQLEAVYGEKILAAPRASGLGLLAWVMPFAFVGAGLLGLAWWTNLRVRRGDVDVSQALPEIPPRLRQRVVAELGE